MPRTPRNRDEFEEQWRLATEGLDPRTIEQEAGFGELHAMFKNLLRSGFTEKQALRILAYGLFQMPEEEPGDST